MSFIKQLKGKTAAKASAALALATFFQKGIVILSIPIFTRLMSPGDYGAFGVFASWIEVLGLLTSLCLSKGVFNNGLHQYKQDRDVFSFSMLVLSNCSTIGVMGIVLGVAFLLPDLFSFPPVLFLIMLIYFLLEPAYNLWSVRQRFEYRYKMQTTVACCSTILSTVIAIALVYLFPGKAVVMRASGMYGILICFYFAFYLYQVKKAGLHINFSYWKYALLFNLPLIPHYLSLYLLSHFDRIMIAGYLGDSAAGIYTLAYQLGSAAGVIWGAINASLIPYTYEKCEKEDYSSIRNTTHAVLAIYAAVCFLVVLAAPELMAILAPSSYGDSVYLVPLVVAGVFFSSLYYIFANVIYYFRKTKYVMFASIVSAVLNVCLNALFIPVFGIVAAAASTVLCYAVQSLIDYWAMKKVVGRSVYNMKFVFFLAAGMLVFSCAATFSYGNLLIRALFAVGTGALAVAFGKILSNRVKSLHRHE